MGLYQWLGKLRGDNRLELAADVVAVRSRNAVWLRVRDRLATLGLNEARGYIRARSAIIVHDHADHVIREQHLVKESQRARLIEAATESVIRQICSQVKVSRPQPFQLRRAA